MIKETLFTIEDLDNPFEREKLENLPNYILVDLLIRHLKREIKAIEYIKEHTKETDFDNDKLIDILEILGDKE